MNNPVDQPKVSELISSAKRMASRPNAHGFVEVHPDFLMEVAAALAAHPQPQATTVGLTALEVAISEAELELGDIENRDAANEVALPEYIRGLRDSLDILRRSALIGIPGAEKGEAVPDDDWQALMDLASKLRVKATARYADDIAQVETMEERAHAIAKASGDLGYLS